MAKKINAELYNNILATLEGKRLTGYDIYKSIKGRYHHLSARLVYHYLRMGVEEGRLAVEESTENGRFSWGETARKKYYTLIRK